jgi:hypothetical protein
MADSAKLEIQSLQESWATSLKERLGELEDAAVRATRIAARNAKRKRVEVEAHLHAALQSLQSQEEQIKQRLAAVEFKEAELASYQQTLAKLELNLETQLQRLSQAPAAPTTIDLPAEFGTELAHVVSVSVERRLAELLQSQEQADESSRSTMLSQLTRLEVRALEAEDQSRLLKNELAEARDEIVLYRQEIEEQVAQRTSLSLLNLQRQEQVEKLQLDLSQSQQELLNQAQQASLIPATVAETERLREELSETKRLAATLQQELEHAKASVSQADSAGLKEQALIDELQAEIASLQAILLATRSTHDSSHASDSDSAQLQCEIADLKRQNSDLAAQLARLQMNASQNGPHSSLCQESMSWEDRKRLILQQLEEEVAESEEPMLQRKRVEISEVLSVTQAELDKREREIQELQSIIEQQSNAHEGVAIGAAAIAQLMDTDELVREERERLRAIQKEWEEKLRHAEIEMSLERAKLGRERAQLEELLRARQSEGSPIPRTVEVTTDRPADTKVDKKAESRPARKWLEHLGLKDG